MPLEPSSLNNLPNLPYEVSGELMDAAARIKLALFDVDGVLTDGSLFYSEDGELFKKFNALDGHGLKMLQLAGIAVGIISARSSTALQRRLDDLGINHIHLGVADKLSVYEQLRHSLDLDDTECAFTGDDVIDLPAMEKCGVKFSVNNAHFIVRELADWVSPLNGGQGAVRSICDILLYSQKIYPIGSSTQQ